MISLIQGSLSKKIQLFIKVISCEYEEFSKELKKSKRAASKKKNLSVLGAIENLEAHLALLEIFIINADDIQESLDLLENEGHKVNVPETEDR